nr:hypothetical protein [Cobetia sp. ICG0124]
MAAALPVSLVILLMTLGLLIALIEESRMALKARRRDPRPAQGHAQGHDTHRCRPAAGLRGRCRA